MASNKRLVQDKDKLNEITIKSVNKPAKEESHKKIKELSEFLSKTWHMPINS